MALCGECGLPQPAGVRYCTDCGARMEMGGVQGGERVIERPKRPEVRVQAPLETPTMEDNGQRVVVRTSRAQQQRGARTGSATRERDEQPEQKDAWARSERPWDDEEDEWTSPRSRARSAEKEVLWNDEDEEDERPRKPKKTRPAARQSAPATARGRGESTAMRVGEYIVNILLMGIPVIGLIVAFLWAKSAGNANKRNLCTAFVVMQIVVIVLGLLGFLVYQLFFKKTPVVPPAA